MRKKRKKGRSAMRILRTIARVCGSFIWLATGKEEVNEAAELESAAFRHLFRFLCPGFFCSLRRCFFLAVLFSQLDRPAKKLCITFGRVFPRKVFAHSGGL